MIRPDKRAKEPKQKKSKRSEYDLVDEPEPVSPTTTTTPTAAASTPMPNIFSQDASGLEGIYINIDDLINTPQSQRQRSTPQETPSQ